MAISVQAFWERIRIGIMKRSSVGINRQYLPYLMLLPAFVFLIGFKFYPILNTFYLSTRYHTLLDLPNARFVGLENFKTLFADPVFRTAFKNSIVWVIANVSIQTVLGMILALILNMDFKGRGLARALVFTPWAVSGVLTAIMWSFMYSESIGVINDVLLRLGWITQRISFVSNSNIAMFAVVLAQIWRGVPFFAINFLSALQTIPGEVYESAQVDGAGAIRRYFFITLPLIKDSIVLTMLLRTIWTLNAADVIYSLTGGGPANATMTVPLMIMTTFLDKLDFGYTSTISVVMTSVLIVFALFFLKITRYGKDS